MYKKSSTRRKANFKKRWLVTLASILVTVLAIGSVLYATDGFPFNDKEDDKPTVTETTANSETKGEPQSDSNRNQDGSVPSDNKSQTNTTNNNTDPSADLKKPEGNFVNNHRPSLSDSSSMQSSCVTTPGATCQIIFTKDGVTKTLPAQKTDAGGGTYWTWTLQDIGLTAGTWKIQAKATLGSQIETTDDAVNLEVAS